MIVTALKPFTHRGRPIVAGNSFDVTPIEAAALQYQRRVRIGRAIGVFTTRDMRPESDTNETNEPTETTRPKRRYQRRDLTAEP